MPGQALSELSAPNSARNGGTIKVNCPPHFWLRLAMHEMKAITRNDCAARKASVRLARIVVSYWISRR
ncbi:hypothetical protein D3C76_1487240 [compost metagenome]